MDPVIGLKYGYKETWDPGQIGLNVLSSGPENGIYRILMIYPKMLK